MPLPYAYLVSGIPTLACSAKSTIPGPSGHLLPAWAPHPVLSPHHNRSYEGKPCDPSAIWNPFDGPYDFSDNHFTQVRHWQVFFHF